MSGAKKADLIAAINADKHFDFAGGLYLAKRLICPTKGRAIWNTAARLDILMASPRKASPNPGSSAVPSGARHFFPGGFR
jgi:hypothetical protein